MVRLRVPVGGTDLSLRSLCPNMSLTVSVVGVGKIGRKHARILASMPDVTLGPLVDVDEARATDVAAALDARTGTLDDAMEAADCLFVCTPDDEHVEIASVAIERGLHTFVEKPLATTAAAEELRAAADESDAVHATGHVLRFDPRYRAVRDSVAAGDLGDVVSVTAERLVKRTRIHRTGAVSRAPMRLGVHDFDLLEWLTGARIESIEAEAAEGALDGEGYDIEETVSVLATLDCGATATLTMGFCLPDGHPGSIVRTVIAGTEGTMSVDASGADTQRFTDESGTAIDSHLWPEVAGTPDGALAAQDRAFVDAVRSGGESPVPFESGSRAVRLAEAAETAVDEGVGVDVSPR